MITPITQFGAPNAPYSDLTNARITIIPAPLEHSVCYMEGTICARTEVVGMDVVEICPMEGQARADFLAAKLVYKMIGYRFFSR